MTREVESFNPTPTIRRFADVLQPSASEPPILSKPIRAAVRQWMVELSAADVLEKVSLKPRRSALLVGPPGCGKTTLAHHLAARLGLPLVLVNMASLVSKYVGETGQNVNSLFDEVYEQADRCVLFLDEFDSMATKRVSVEHGSDKERNGIVISLLQKIDAFPGTMIAATNVGDDIDQAIWRRFGMHLEVLEPDDDCRFAIIKRYLDPMDLPDDDLDTLTVATAGATPALLRQLMEGVKRDLVLSPRMDLSTDAKSVFGRVLVAVRAHADATQPALWTDSAMRTKVEAISWPPKLTDGRDLSMLFGSGPQN